MRIIIRGNTVEVWRDSAPWVRRYHVRKTGQLVSRLIELGFSGKLINDTAVFAR